MLIFKRLFSSDIPTHNFTFEMKIDPPTDKKWSPGWIKLHQNCTFGENDFNKNLCSLPIYVAMRQKLWHLKFRSRLRKRCGWKNSTPASPAKTTSAFGWPNQGLAKQGHWKDLKLHFWTWFRVISIGTACNISFTGQCASTAAFSCWMVSVSAGDSTVKVPSILGKFIGGALQMCLKIRGHSTPASLQKKNFTKFPEKIQVHNFPTTNPIFGLQKTQEPWSLESSNSNIFPPQPSYYILPRALSSKMHSVL